jgi:hypothetical protein
MRRGGRCDDDAARELTVPVRQAFDGAGGHGVCGFAEGDHADRGGCGDLQCGDSVACRGAGLRASDRGLEQLRQETARGGNKTR